MKGEQQHEHALLSYQHFCVTSTCLLINVVLVNVVLLQNFCKTGKKQRGRHHFHHLNRLSAMQLSNEQGQLQNWHPALDTDL
jgi:hypothetical protein